MLARLCIFSCAATVALSGVASCKDRQACERARLKMEGTWESVMSTAGKRKIPSSYEELSPADKAARLAQWQPIQDQAETLRSSFETEQVTWNAADKAIGKLEEKLKEIPTGADPLNEAFAKQFELAKSEYAEFCNQCR
ncbi:MAG: hypothetical protein JW940_04910 [Polyangiaceae bacterium]|nr:hypothetical protein [Polyangiaceae bacterium]